MNPSSATPILTSLSVNREFNNNLEMILNIIQEQKINNMMLNKGSVNAGQTRSSLKFTKTLSDYQNRPQPLLSMLMDLKNTNAKLAAVLVGIPEAHPPHTHPCAMGGSNRPGILR